jgi:hypothetical protein
MRAYLQVIIPDAMIEENAVRLYLDAALELLVRVIDPRQHRSIEFAGVRGEVELYAQAFGKQSTQYISKAVAGPGRIYDESIDRSKLGKAR